MALRFLPLLLLLGTSAAASAQQLSVPQVTLQGDAVALSFELHDAFDKETVERIESGLPTTFSFQFELLRDRKRWWDERLVDCNLEVVAMYNAVTHEYLVNFKHNGKLVESRLAHDLADLKQDMTHFEKAPCFALEGLPRDRRLLVKGRAVVGSRTILSFIPSQITTDWVESHKFRVPPPSS